MGDRDVLVVRRHANVTRTSRRGGTRRSAPIGSRTSRELATARGLRRSRIWAAAVRPQNVERSPSAAASSTLCAHGPHNVERSRRTAEISTLCASPRAPRTPCPPLNARRPPAKARQAGRRRNTTEGADGVRLGADRAIPGSRRSDPAHPAGSSARTTCRRRVGSGRRGARPARRRDRPGPRARFRRGIGPADAVVGDVDHDLAVDLLDRDLRGAGGGVLRDVRERLHHDEVRCRLDRAGSRSSSGAEIITGSGARAARPVSA